MKRILADLRAADVHKGSFWIDYPRLDPKMRLILRAILLFAGIDAVRQNTLVGHIGLNTGAPDIPAVRIRLHALFVKGVNMNIFLIFEGLQQPAQAIADRRLLRHGAVFKQLAIARVVIAHHDMQLIDLATGALDQINVPGVQRIKLAEYHANGFLTTRKLQP